MVYIPGAKGQINHSALHNPAPRTRTASIVKAAVNEGKSLPLAVLLKHMWAYDELADVYAKIQDHDPHLLGFYRKMAVTIAEKAAPYVHPKLQNVAVRPEDDEEAEDRRLMQQLTRDSIKGKSVKELGQLYLALAKGDEKELSELVAPSSAAELPPETPPTSDVSSDEYVRRDER